jgi:hypothetical protein
MASTMNKRITIGLLFAACSLASSAPFANPAITDDVETLDIVPEFIDAQDNARPAENSAHATTNLTVDSNSVTTGTVLNSNKSIHVHQVDFPRRGMSADKVQNELGSPNEIRPAVGSPPISQWVYNDRVIYFEHSTVLHVVAK